MAATGVTTIDFGSAPGTNVVTVSISDTNIGASSAAEAYIMGEATASHSAYEHLIVPIQLVCTVTASTGFVITASSEMRLTGVFNVRWVWADGAGAGGSYANPMTTSGDTIYGGASGVATRLAKGTNGQVMSLVAGLPAWIDFAGGSIDWEAPIAITGATTLTIGKHHVCTGTTADYTVTLPAVSGNAGKQISIEMSGALTKLVTVDGNASEVIDGSLTRIMWAQETALLLCDGTQWTKIAGKSLPMSAGIKKSTGQLYAFNTNTKILCDASLSLYTNMSAMQDLANSRIVVKRPGQYVPMVTLASNNSNTTAHILYAKAYVNSAGVFSAAGYTPASTILTILGTSAPIGFALGDLVELYGFFNAGTYTTSSIYGTDGAYIILTETPIW